jgi:uncharacterized protein (TIRG00374 family)
MNKMYRKAKSWTYPIIAFVLGIGVLLALIHLVGFERFFDVILKTSPYWIGVSVIVYAASWIFRAWRLQQLTAHAAKTIKIFDLFKLHISGYALNAILPAKLGDAATVGYLKVQGIGIGRSAAIVLQARILDLLALILLSIPGFVFLWGKGAPYWMIMTLIFCTVLVVVPVAIVAFDRDRRLSAVSEYLQNRLSHRFLKLAVEKMNDAYEGYHDIVSDRKLLAASILLSLVIWLLDGLTGYAVSIAVGAKVPIIAVVLAVSVANVGKTVPATPGGVGIYEGILATALVLFGTSLDVALVIAILDHAIKKLFNLTFGVPATMVLGLNIAQLLEMAGDEEA